MSNFSFEPLKLKLATNNIIIPMENGVADLTNAETSAKIMLAGKELFPIFDESIGGRNLFSYSIMKKGYIYPSSADDIIQYKNFHYTPEFISTNDYEYVTYTVYDYGNSEERGYSISFYDAEKKPIQQKFNWATEINVPVTIKLLEGVQYFRFTIVNTGIKAKLELGNKATDWTPAPEEVLQNATLTYDNCSAAIVDDLVKITSHKPGTTRGWVDVTVNYGNLSNTKRLNWSVEGVEPYKPSGTLLTMNNRGIKY